MTINIYYSGHETNYQYKMIAHHMKVRSSYSDTYYRNMPTLSAKRCREILDKICPHFKLDCESFLFVDVATGYTGTQNIYRHGTVLNF